MGIRLLIPAFLLLLGTAGSAAAKQPAALAVNDGRGDHYLETVVTRLEATGGAWAVVRDGKIEHLGVAGRDGNGQPMTADTRFLLGSVSKPVAATLAVTLDSEGRIKLDIPVIRALPELGVIQGAQAITARQLLNHISGLPFGAAFLDRADPDRTPAQVVAELKGVKLISTPGQRYTYSSLGYLVLTAWLEKVTGRPLPELYARTLGMKDTAPSAATVPPGKRGPWLPPMPAPTDPAGMGYGYTAGSVRTLAEFARQSLADLTRLNTMTGTIRPLPGETRTGLGWRITHEQDGTRRIWHTGTVPGYFTAVHLVPAEKLAVVFAVNRSGYLDETRLYNSSAGLLAIARGRDAVPPGNSGNTLAALAGIVTVAILGLFLTRLRGWRRGLGLVLLSGPMLLAAALGVPVRYGWLWIPELIIVLVVGGLAVMITALTSSRTAQRREQPREVQHEPLRGSQRKSGNFANARNNSRGIRILGQRPDETI